ncbi:uncharacterized protein MYCFIDRAFT_189123 [Pseudocercospora fijiensis CIRAD86]|uniref:Phytanoyl-CoA dioxygenase n=1 Tax=Pseudocercospora fijiensis (strain CIRAD86) TaxID=383855 RepID=M3AZ89_PSEFD|nr:uncharacterized protein MYCFIDRAFT_189123 [Pseudocercospora fijiensis CIRAD86]EME82498.1 hypothetical protein MYCFIDRAFT_189123 [Pseudocercospora fijiensis CIRAD86]
MPLLSNRIQAAAASIAATANNPPSLTAFKALVEQTTTKETYPLAKTIENNIPIYDCTAFDLNDSTLIDHLQDELYHILTSGPGVYILKHFFPSARTISLANTTFSTILSSTPARGDHFARTPGTNSRLWNSFTKHCLSHPQNFFEYYSNPWFRIVAEAHLGPNFRITAQLNIVHPGSEAQIPHRDYHLGFPSLEQCAEFPKASHQVSAVLTLQGAVAHTDMPLESGPTRFVPYSQLFPEAFVSTHFSDFQTYFLDNYVSLPLAAGDALFFSPAIFHSAGSNTTSHISRSANLFQISSAFGKAMEIVETLPLIEATYEVLEERYRCEGFSCEVEAFVHAVAEGYGFPTDLDRNSPGNERGSEQGVLRRGLREGWGRERVLREIRGMRGEGEG